MTEDIFAAVPFVPSLIIDPGHGGADGGAVSSCGIAEAEINLEISMRLRDILRFFGVSSVMTREDENSLDFSSENTLRQNKRNDLKARLVIAENNPSCDFLSIHLNKYISEKYSGAQVFYSGNNPDSALLARTLQEKMRFVLDKNNGRKAKLSPNSVFLMDKILSPAVTIECGFLSNPGEAKLLANSEYQNKIAVSICCGYIEYIEMGDI